MIRKCIGLFIGILLTTMVSGQHFEVTLLDETTQNGIPDPMIPVIFHMEAVNTTENEFHVDLIREEENIPDGWETALCTEACFPPEVSEAIFFMDPMATDEASVYFYPSSEGVGNVHVKLVNTQDSSNYYEYTFYVNTNPAGIDQSILGKTVIVYDNHSQSIWIEGINVKGLDCMVIAANGTTLKHFFAQSNTLSIDASSWAIGTYVVKLGEDIIKRVVIH